MSSTQQLMELKNNNLKKYRIIVWDQEGMSIHAIAKNLDMDRKDVRKNLDKFNQYGSVEIDLRSITNGKTPILTESKLREVEKIILENEPMSLEGIKEEIKEEMDLEISRGRLSKALRNLGSFLKPTWTPFLTTQHKIDRLAYCKTHFENHATFHNFIFTDESRFYMNRNTKKVFVVTGQQVPQKQKFNPDYSVMVWGAICYEGTLHLDLVEGRMNHEHYIEILERCFNDALPSLNPRTKWRFQQDGAGPHRPPKVRDFISENGLAIMKHPSNSPDLNPIELIWAYMKEQIEGLEIKNKQDLEDAIFETWAKIPDQVVKNCIDHLRQYLPRVIEVGGALPSRAT